MRKLNSRLLDKSLIARGVSQSRLTTMSDTKKIELLEEVTTEPAVTFDTSVTPIEPTVTVVGPVTVVKNKIDSDDSGVDMSESMTITV